MLKTTAAAFTALLLLSPIASAQTKPTTTATEAAAATATSAAPPRIARIDEVDSRETRNQLHELLQRHPPEVGKVLKLDPALWKNEAYLANYPALAAFLAEHPEVAHNPGFFLESVWVPGDPERDSGAIRMWRDTMEGVIIFCVLIGVTSVLTWLVKTLIEHRRWSRLSRVQYEVHNKLFDRFSSNEDLLAYIQTPAGRRFLESAPIPLESGSRPVSAPINRILWSVQAGVVLAMVGLGLFYVSNNIQKEVSQPMFALGVLVLSVGAGFVISAVVSYILSRKLGLFAATGELASADTGTSLGE